jgi:hypothetical protein
MWSVRRKTTRSHPAQAALLERAPFLKCLARNGRPACSGQPQTAWLLKIGSFTDDLLAAGTLASATGRLVCCLSGSGEARQERPERPSGTPMGVTKVQTSEPIDVRDMAIVHGAFRRAYEESAQLVRSGTVAVTRASHVPG